MMQHRAWQTVGSVATRQGESQKVAMGLCWGKRIANRSGMGAGVDRPAPIEWRGVSGAT